MKPNRTYIFIAVSSLALAALLFIQVSWIVKTAKIKEELFSEKANMVLSATAKELCSDKETCENMGNCCYSDSGRDCKLQLGKDEIHKIDSLLKKFMSLYNFHIDYSFEVIKQGMAPEDGKNLPGNIFKTRLEEVAIQNGLELKLIFPEKRQFIIAEMGPLFIVSVLFILVVLILFWSATLSLLREKKISEQTNEFLKNMTHEFKTPLTNISLAGKMILKEPALANDKVKHYGGIILSENEKLRQQVEQVLGMAALERGEIPLLRTKTDLHEIISRVLVCMAVQVEPGRDSIKQELRAEKSFIWGDRNHLANAFTNLVDNAIKYAKGVPEITISSYNQENFIIVQVADRGIGIESKHIKSIFNKYFRVPTGDVHDVKGFGLGLAYVKKIIDLHGGGITVESEKGKGTVFILKLPLHNE